jgi:hypothetical protein
MTKSDGKEAWEGGRGGAGETFLHRWVKRKAEARSGGPDPAEPSAATDSREGAPAEVPASPQAIETQAIETQAIEARAPEESPRREPPERSDVDMPPLESLDQDSDYSPFLSRGVSPELRQTALRQLFRQPKFNVETCLDDFQDDFLNFQPLGDIVTADMRHMAEVEAKREATRIARAAEETPRSEPRPTGDLPASGEADGPVPGAHADATGEADPRATAGDEPPGSSDGATPPDDPTRMKS